MVLVGAFVKCGGGFVLVDDTRISCSGSSDGGIPRCFCSGGLR